ncbi:MAG: EamA family transporter [Pyrinomonadaceae bacterium]
MSFTALGLLVGAAILHAAWNLLLKQTNEKYVVTWWALLVGSLCFLPLMFTGQMLPLHVLPLAALSAFFEAAYFVSLAAAYRDADFSLIYPIARGTAPALLAMWSILFLGERLSYGGILGLTIIVCGLVTISSSAIFKRHAATPNLRSVILAFLVALFISAYSVVDGGAVRLTSPIKYMVVVFGLTMLFITPFMFKFYGWQKLKKGWEANWLRASSIGFLILASYGLVLIAFTIAPVSYSGAVRESSIVVGALAGCLFLGEGFGRTRVLASVVIFAGILVIALAG